MRHLRKVPLSRTALPGEPMQEVAMKWHVHETLLKGSCLHAGGSATSDRPGLAPPKARRVQFIRYRASAHIP